MLIKWNEESIRKEIVRLDAKTGLHGADLPITFSNSVWTIGVYNSENGGSFRFSNYYYQNPDWPVEEALDIIRHEYAHYMDHMLYGRFGHGKTWKYCCNKVGAYPTRCYNEQRTDYHKHKHVKEAKLSEQFDRYHIGMCIEHPLFGTGVIKSINGISTNRSITVVFDHVGEKKLGLAWVDKNCKKSFL